MTQSYSRADGAAAELRGQRPSGERSAAGSPARTDHREHCCQIGEPLPEGETPDSLSIPICHDNRLTLTGITLGDGLFNNSCVPVRLQRLRWRKS